MPDFTCGPPALTLLGNCNSRRCAARGLVRCRQSQCREDAQQVKTNCQLAGSPNCLQWLISKSEIEAEWSGESGAIGEGKGVFRPLLPGCVPHPTLRPYGHHSPSSS